MELSVGLQVFKRFGSTSALVIYTLDERKQVGMLEESDDVELQCLQFDDAL